MTEKGTNPYAEFAVPIVTNWCYICSQKEKPRTAAEKKKVKNYQETLFFNSVSNNFIVKNGNERKYIMGKIIKVKEIYNPSSPNIEAKLQEVFISFLTEKMAEKM